MGRPYIVTGLVRTSASGGGGLLISVELLFNAAEATNPPAPRVEEGIIHGMAGFDGDEGSFVGADSVLSSGSSFIWEEREGVEWDALNRETALYGEFPSVGS